MKDDIRVVYQVGTITTGEGKWQKELNIVSINNGPMTFDLREWSLDHTTHRNGISFGNEEAKVLLAVLKECFQNGGDDITIPTPPGTRRVGDGGQDGSKTTGDGQAESSNDDLYALLEEKGIEYTDKREKGGALWIIGGHELDDLIADCAKLGYKFYYSEKGGRTTKGKPGWYLPAKKKA